MGVRSPGRLNWEVSDNIPGGGGEAEKTHLENHPEKTQAPASSSSIHMAPSLRGSERAGNASRAVFMCIL